MVVISNSTFTVTCYIYTIFICNSIYIYMSGYTCTYASKGPKGRLVKRRARAATRVDVEILLTYVCVCVCV